MFKSHGIAPQQWIVFVEKLHVTNGITLTLPELPRDLTIAKKVPIRGKGREFLTEVKRTAVFYDVHKASKIGKNFLRCG